MPELPYSADCVGYREEYALVHVESAEGAFVGEIRRACEKVLVDVSKQCFDTEVLNSKNGRKDSGERFPLEQISQAIRTARMLSCLSEISTMTIFTIIITGIPRRRNNCMSAASD